MKKILTILTLSISLMGCGGSNNDDIFSKKPITKTITKSEIMEIVDGNFEEKSRTKDFPYSIIAYNVEKNEQDKEFNLTELGKSNIPRILFKDNTSGYKIVDGETKEVLDGEYGNPTSCEVFKIENGKFVSRNDYHTNRNRIPEFRETNSNFIRDFRFVKDFEGSSFAFTVQLYYTEDIINKEQFNGTFMKIKAIELDPTGKHKIWGGFKDKNDIFKFKKEVYSTLNIKEDFENTWIAVMILDNEGYHDLKSSLGYRYRNKDKSEEFFILRGYETKYFDE